MGGDGQVGGERSQDISFPPSPLSSLLLAVAVFYKQLLWGRPSYLQDCSSCQVPADMGG